MRNRIAIASILALLSTNIFANGYGYKIIKHTSESTGFIESGYNSSYNNDSSNEDADAPNLKTPNESAQKNVRVMSVMTTTKNVSGKVAMDEPNAHHFAESTITAK